MKRIIGIGLMFGIILSSSIALAEDAKVKEIVFQDDQIEGELMLPSDKTIEARKTDELSSLVKARDNFSDEMPKTINEL